MMIAKERRSGERTKCCTRAHIVGESAEVSGLVENLSLNGMFLRTEENLPTYENVSISISYRDNDEPKSFELTGVVSRQDSEGMGIQFKEMNIASFKSLKNMVEYFTFHPEATVHKKH